MDLGGKDGSGTERPLDDSLNYHNSGASYGLQQGELTDDGGVQLRQSITSSVPIEYRSPYQENFPTTNRFDYGYTSYGYINALAPDYSDGSNYSRGYRNAHAPNYSNGPNPSHGYINAHVPDYSNGPNSSHDYRNDHVPDYSDGSNSSRGYINAHVPNYSNGPTSLSRGYPSISNFSVPSYSNGLAHSQKTQDRAHSTIVPSVGPPMFITNSEIPMLFRRGENHGKRLGDTLVLTARGRFIEAATCMDYMRMRFGNNGQKLLQHVGNALESVGNDSCCSDMDVKVAEGRITVTARAGLHDLRRALIWLCLAVRKPKPGILISTGHSGPDGSNRFVLDNLTRFPSHEGGASCWHGLMDSAVVAVEPDNKLSDNPQLRVDFNVMIELSAVEYPVKVDSGLILLGYSTALVPIEVSGGEIIWHLEVCSHDSQFKIDEIEAIRLMWLKTMDFTFLRSRKARLGWRSAAAVLLGTERLPPTVGWSKAERKRTSWTWKGANLQAMANSAAPAQIGLQGGLTFERSTNVLRFDRSRNYLRLLNSSSREAIIIYDVESQRAWLVSLLSTIHHMAVRYCRDISKEDQVEKIPFAQPEADGGTASLTVLRKNGSIQLESGGEDALTLRDLIMGLSVNLSKMSSRKPRNHEVYGYEFMDIVRGAPEADLKRIRIEKQGRTWAPLLQGFSCLFCSGLGDAIVGSNTITGPSPCDTLIAGLDLMAASLYCIRNVSESQGGGATGSEYRLPGGTFGGQPPTFFRSVKRMPNPAGAGRR